jgi:dTDP-L-rhamnose 4-epimerase
VLGVDAEPEVTGKFRAGDIRHCFADIAKARRLLGYEPQVELEDGMRELAGWLETQTAEDRVEDAAAELAARGLAR